MSDIRKWFMKQHDKGTNAAVPTTKDNAPGKGSSSTRQNPELTDIHPYPDWATIQAFYSHGVPLQQPGFNPGVSDCHFPPQACLWTPPQAMIPFYGLPYPVHYSQGLVFAQPSAPLVSAFSKDSLSESADKIDQGTTVDCVTLALSGALFTWSKPLL